eukprot:GILI01022176.1.p1 GENE.GILI01022176.1~~GILI01022176.1.p1  ORF type:complete len:127 (+),score=27.64 GILI01022176.1:55-381(+)
MGVSPYSIFLRQTAKNQALNKLPIGKRGKAVAKLYKALSASDKAALIKQAKATPVFKRNRVNSSVLEQARAKKIPTGLVRRSWFSTKGSTQSRLNKIALKAGLKVRTA